MRETFRERDIVAPTKTELLLGVGCWLLYLVGISALLLLLLPLLGVDLNSERGGSLAQLAAFALDFILIVLVFRKFLWRSAAPLKGNGKRLLSTVLLGFAAYYLLMYLVALLIAYLSLGLDVLPENLNNEVIGTIMTQYTFPMAVCTVVFAPVTEECLVRGVLFAPICRRKPWIAYLVTTALFGLLHTVPYIGTQELSVLALSFLQYLPAGIVLGWAYQRTRSIWGAIALHSLINLVAVAAML